MRKGRFALFLLKAYNINKSIFNEVKAMNTIKIYLAESGRIADLQKDFPLYQGQFQNKLLNIFVPTSILAPEFSSQSSSYVAATSVKIGMTYTARDGAIKVSKNYYMRYLKTLVYKGVEYALYERKLPKEFTFYAGQGENSPVLIVNVVNIDTEAETPVVLSVITSQTCHLDVMASTNLDKDEDVEPSELENLNAQVQAINATLPLKQDKTDDTLTTDDKTVVGAINEVDGHTDENTANISSNTTNISDLQSRVTTLENTVSGAETPVGTMKGTTLPTNDELSAFTLSELGRNPKPNDSIIFVLEIVGATDKNYKYIYGDNNKWNSFEIPPIEQASNGSLGVIKGTFGINSTNNVLVDITGGEIKNVYYKDNEGVYRNIQTKINLIDVLQTNIVNGTQVVGISTKALQDQLGNVINLTYAKQSDVYTKSESDSKYLPITYTNIYYYSADGFVENVPTTPASGIQFTKTVNAIGTANVFSIDRVLTGNYNFTKNSTDRSAIWVSANRKCSVQFRLTTKVKKVGQAETLLSAELTNEIALAADTPTLVEISSIYLALGNNSLKANAGDTFTKSLDVITTESTETTINVYSNAVYPSTFNLVAQSITFDVNTLNGMKSINVLTTDWTANTDGTFSTTIPQTRHQQAPNTNYFIDLQELVAANTYERIAFSAKIDTDGNITLTTTEKLDCVLLIASSITDEERGILTLTNPVALPAIDYTTFGALRIEQTETATALTLPAPADVGKFATFFVSNSATSTKEISINGEDISINSGMQFKWNGSQWQVGEQPTDTDEVYDKDKSQLLSKTLQDMQSATSNNSAALKSKLDDDLGNVDLTGLGEKVFDCNLNKSIYRETSTGVDLTSLEYDGQYNISLVFDFTADNQTITQNIPQALNSTIDIRLALQQGSTYHTGCKVVLTPVNGATINGTASTVELTADGYNGTLKPDTDGHWLFDRIGEVAAIKVSDGTTDIETAKLVADSASGLEVYKDGANTAGLRIKPAILAKTAADNFYAKLNGSEYINFNGIDGKIWAGDIEASGSSYVYAEKNTKSVICQAIGDDTETAFSIKFVADFGDVEAQSDGYVSIYAQDNATGTILTDDNGKPLGVKEYFKTGDKITRLVAYGIKTFSSMVKVGFVVENGFNEVLELTQDTCYSIQSLQVGKQVSAGDNAFDIATGLRWDKQFRYYYNDLLSLDWLKNETVAEQTLADGFYNYNDGLHVDVTGTLKFSVANGNIKLSDDGSNIVFCAFGRVFDRIDTANLKGKTLNVAFKGENKNNAWDMRLLIYTGANAGVFDSKIVTGITDGNLTLASGWTQVSSIFITEDVSGEHEVSGTFAIPTTAFDRMAIVITPNAQQNPNSITIKDFNASLATGFTDRELILGTTVREEHLRYDRTYAKFEDNNQGYAQIRYTINSGATKLPFGEKTSGNGAIKLVKIWQDNAKLTGEGGLNFTNKDKVTMRVRIPLHRGEGATGVETTTFAIYRRSAGTDTEDIASPTNFDIANFAEIAGTSQAFVVEGTDTVYINYVTSFTLNKNGETIILVGKTTHNDGSYIDITTKTPLITNIQGIEIV
jgi:hypothetical protein